MEARPELADRFAAARMGRAVMSTGPLIRSVVLKRDEVPSFGAYPFSIPAVRDLNELVLDPHVTLFAGENGSGKSTLIEAIAVAAGFNPEGGSRHMTFSSRPSHSDMHKYLRLVRGTRPPSAAFLRSCGECTS